jgi:hypothetical protein
MTDICDQLKINPSIFEGHNIPDNIRDIMVFFSIEISNKNNIPYHINLKLDEFRRNPGILENVEEFIRNCRVSWLLNELSKQINRDEKNMNMKINCIYNFVCICMENPDIYRLVNHAKFYKNCLTKVTQVLELSCIDENHYSKIKCREFLEFLEFIGMS